MKVHQHEEYIRAWLDGKNVSFTWGRKVTWYDVTSLNDFMKGEQDKYDDIEFIIAPEKKPDITCSIFCYLNDENSISFYYQKEANLKLTFDGETRQPIKSEVI